MTEQHPINPPMELKQQLYGLPQTTAIEKAFQAGADQELKACCKWLGFNSHDPLSRSLRAARRPKPPTLAEQGCNALDSYIYGNPDHGDKQNTYNTIRAALNRLAELEQQTTSLDTRTNESHKS